MRRHNATIPQKPLPGAYPVSFGELFHINT